MVEKSEPTLRLDVGGNLKAPSRLKWWFRRKKYLPCATTEKVHFDTMTMHPIFFKERELLGINLQKPFGIGARWTGLGSQLGEAFGQLKSNNSSASWNHLGKENPTHFTSFSDDCKNGANVAKTQLQTAMEYAAHLELGQPLGRVMLPLNLSNDNNGGAIFVNAKQYYRILRRRESRAKAEQQNKVLKLRKPYLHLSRHLHAKRRPRGCGGRFLKTKNSNGSKEKTETKMNDQEKVLFYKQPTGSQMSEILQSSSNGSRLNSPGSSEETSWIFSGTSRIGLHSFHLNHRFQPLSDHVANPGCGIAMAGDWIIATADNCYNSKV